MSTYEFLPHLWIDKSPAGRTRWHRDNKTNRTGYLGVTQRGPSRFEARITAPGRKHKLYCGIGRTAAAAARLYDAKALELFGPTAVTNFPQDESKPD